MISFLIRCCVYAGAGLLAGCAGRAAFDSGRDSAARHGIAPTEQIKLAETRDYSVTIPNFTGKGLDGMVINISPGVLMFVQTADAQAVGGGHIANHFVIPIMDDRLPSKNLIGGVGKDVALFRAHFSAESDKDGEIILVVAAQSEHPDGRGPTPVEIDVYRLKKRHLFGPPGTYGTDIATFVPALSWHSVGLYCAPSAAIARAFGMPLRANVSRDGC